MRRLVKDVEVPPRKMVVLTPEQNEYVEKFRQLKGCSASEAVRRIIQAAADLDRSRDYERLLDALAE